MLNMKFKSSLGPWHPSWVQGVVDNRCADKVVFIDTSHESISKAVDKLHILSGEARNGELYRLTSLFELHMVGKPELTILGKSLQPMTSKNTDP